MVGVWRIVGNVGGDVLVLTLFPSTASRQDSVALLPVLLALASRPRAALVLADVARALAGHREQAFTPPTGLRPDQLAALRFAVASGALRLERPARTALTVADLPPLDPLPAFSPPTPWTPPPDEDPPALDTYAPLPPPSEPLPTEPTEPPPSAASPPEAPRPPGWLDLVVMDPWGQPLDGIAWEIDHDGTTSSCLTDGAGRVHVPDVTAPTGQGRLADPQAARARLRSRCQQRPPPADTPANLAGVERLELGALSPAVTLVRETPTTLMLVRPLTRVRLIGMHFDTSKCFLRSTAMRGIRQVVEVYQDNPTGSLLIVGHTDTTGDDAYNLDLSVERALAVKAYLQDDVAAWEAWYSPGKPPDKRWGSHEDQEMIEALPCEHTVSGFQGWSNAERGTSLKVDGATGPKTRHALIEAYMALDDTTLPPGIEVVVHGCGEYFPETDVGDQYGQNGVEAAENRRVEMFSFDDEVSPPAPGLKATKGEPEYAQWVNQTTRTVDVSSEKSEDDNLHLRLHDGNARPMKDVPYRIRLGTKAPVVSTSPDGWVTVPLPSNACPAQISLEWGPVQPDGRYLYQMDVMVDCDQGNEREQTTARLHNLGYDPAGAGYEQALEAFQSDYYVPEKAEPGGPVPPLTRAKLWSLWQDKCDASRPAL